MTAVDSASGARRRLSAPRIADIVADELRRQIIDGELADGDLLPRQEVLVERFSVSLVSLREALRLAIRSSVARRICRSTPGGSAR